MSGFTFGSIASKPNPITTASGFSFGAISTPVASTTSGIAGFATNVPSPASGFKFGAVAGNSPVVTVTGTQPSALNLFSKPTQSTPSSFTGFGSLITSAQTLNSQTTNLGFNLTKATPALSSTAQNASNITPQAALSFKMPSTLNTTSPFALPSTSTTNLSTTSSPFSFSQSLATTAQLPSTIPTTASGLMFSTSGVSALAPNTSTLTSVANASTTETGIAKTQSTLTYRQLEDMVNKWTYELDEQERHFAMELGRLNKADRILIENADKIANIHSTVESCTSGQNRVEQELEFVESQQRELESLLEPLEQMATDLPPSQQHADAEREAIFQMCINTDLELGQLLNELREMADQVNSATTDLSESNVSTKFASTNKQDATVTKTGSTNVIGQVTRILNSHMHSLSWLNQNTQELMDKIKFFATP